MPRKHLACHTAFGAAGGRQDSIGRYKNYFPEQTAITAFRSVGLPVNPLGPSMVASPTGHRVATWTGAGQHEEFKSLACRVPQFPFLAHG